ncbi:uncharacterized protein LOC113357504 isoform X1 [Papaver somniferum]|uniref:uncharacterized protein LOC113357504 isoform X1 n=1 Tax=Papaver somniferum TaxID=3469 RepID=UPI000E704812|nr:uncharacterized protein LOC113357504 isoform X1 [Papaver somniferum]
MKEFNILTPLLEVLEIDTNGCRHRDLEYCEFKIHAPLLVSLICSGVVAKDYVLMCSFLVLDYAEVSFTISDDESGRWEQRISHVIRKFVGALSRVRQLSLSLSVSRTEALSVADDFVSNLPTFQNLNKLNLCFGATKDIRIYALLGVAPNLECLVFSLESVQNF